MVYIRRCSINEIRYDVRAERMIAAYAAECAIPDAQPQWDAYKAMEDAGVLVCFAADVDYNLVGFVSVIVARMPHHGKLVATVESIYASPEYREEGAGNQLMATAEKFARGQGCVCLTYTARVGSRLETILALRAGCERSHEMFTKWF